jgi:hypothetical protein
VVPQLNCWFLDDCGNLASLARWAKADRRKDRSLSPMLPISLTKRLAAPRYPDTAPRLQGWCLMSGNPCVQRGNAPFAGADTWPPEAWDYMQVLPPCGDALDPVEAGAVRKLWKFGEYDERSVTGGPKV